MPEKEVLYHEPIQVHPFHHSSASAAAMHQSASVPSSSPYPNLQIPSAFVAFQTSPTAAAAAAAAAAAHGSMAAGVANHLEHHAHMQRQTQSNTQSSAAPSSHQIGHNQMSHLHHHSAQSLQVHEANAARYLWDHPSAMAAANFHHPSAHG